MGDERRDFVRQVAAKAARKLKARRGGASGSWSALGMFGVVGWSVATPTLLGVVLGRWWDARHPRAAHSFTLMLLVAGLLIGCVSAWYWVAKEQTAMCEQAGDDDA
jgi:ATP synthase protein I